MPTYWKNSDVHHMNVHGTRMAIHYQVTNDTVRILAAKHGDADIQHLIDPDIKEEIKQSILFTQVNREA